MAALRVAVVTEANHPLAAAIATALTLRGFSLILQHRNCPDATRRTAALAARITAATVNVGLLDEDDARQALRAKVLELGPRLHALVHATPVALGRARPGEKMRHLFDGSTSLLVASQICAPLMQRGDAIVCVLPESARAGGAPGECAEAASSGAELAVCRYPRRRPASSAPARRARRLVIARPTHH
jgi:NAD(P)-dependent dehydrogenase (short-subunit alcohol dehydrogenase family)